MKNSVIRTKAAFLLALVALLTIGCGEEAAQPGGAQAAAMPPMPVPAMMIKTADLPVTLAFPAKLISSGHVEVRSKVSGTLLSREYDEGSFVLKDTLLYVIDPAKYEVAKDAAEAAFKQAEREYGRAKALFTDRAISERERDAALAAYESTRAALKNAMLDLDYTRVKAPIEGFAGIKAQHTGNLISAGALLTTVTQIDPIHAEFAFADMDKLKEGFALQKGSWASPTGIGVAIESESGYEYPQSGRIDFIDAVIDTQSGSVKARAVIANPEGMMLPGQFARVKLSGLIKRDAVRIPQEAVMQGPQGSFVYAVREGKATPQPVVIAQEEGKFFILKSGLKEGDTIITGNLMKIRPGAPVAPQLGE